MMVAPYLRLGSFRRLDEVIQLSTHQKNIDRYQRLLKTKLNETERQYLEKRVCEEKIAMLQFMEHQPNPKEFWV